MILKIFLNHLIEFPLQNHKKSIKNEVSPRIAIFSEIRIQKVTKCSKMLPKTFEKAMKNRLRFQEGFRSEFGVFRGGLGG